MVRDFTEGTGLRVVAYGINDQGQAGYVVGQGGVAAAEMERLVEMERDKDAEIASLKARRAVVCPQCDGAKGRVLYGKWMHCMRCCDNVTKESTGAIMEEGS